MSTVAEWMRDHGINPAHVDAWHGVWGVKHAQTDGPHVVWSHAHGTGRLALTEAEFMALAEAADKDERA